MKKNLLPFLLSATLLMTSCASSSESKDATRTTLGDERSLEIIQAIQKSFKNNGGEDISYYYQGETDSYYIVGAVNKADADLATLMQHSSAYLLEGYSVVTALTSIENDEGYSMKYSYDSNDISVNVVDYSDEYNEALNDIKFSVRVTGSNYVRGTTYQNESCVDVIETISFNMFGNNVFNQDYNYSVDYDYYYALGLASKGSDTMLSLIRKASNYLPSDFQQKSSPQYSSDGAYYKAVYTCYSGKVTVDVFTYKDSDYETYLDLQFSVFLSEEE